MVIYHWQAMQKRPAEYCSVGGPPHKVPAREPDTPLVDSLFETALLPEALPVTYEVTDLENPEDEPPMNTIESGLIVSENDGLPVLSTQSELGSHPNTSEMTGSGGEASVCFSNIDDNLTLDDLMGVIQDGPPETGMLAALLRERPSKLPDFCGEDSGSQEAAPPLVPGEHELSNHMDRSVKAIQKSIASRRLEVIRLFDDLASRLRYTPGSEEALAWLAEKAQGFWQMNMPRMLAKSMSRSVYEADRHTLESFAHTFKDLDVPMGIVIQFEYLHSVNVAFCELTGRPRHYFHQPVRCWELLSDEDIIPYIQGNLNMLSSGRTSNKRRVKVLNRSAPNGYVEAILISTIVRGVQGIVHDIKQHPNSHGSQPLVRMNVWLI